MSGICDRCQSNRILDLYGSVRDMGCQTYQGRDRSDDYMVPIPHICGSEEIELQICLECGKVQGEFPVSDPVLKPVARMEVLSSQQKQKLLRVLDLVVVNADNSLHYRLADFLYPWGRDSWNATQFLNRKDFTKSELTLLREGVYWLVNKAFSASDEKLHALAYEGLEIVDFLLSSVEPLRR